MSELSSVKVGDELIARRGGYGVEILKVDRVTATQVICGKSRFNLRTGRAVGGDVYFSWHAYVPREGEIQKVKDERERQHLAGKLMDYPWRKASLEDLRDIWATACGLQKVAKEDAK